MDDLKIRNPSGGLVLDAIRSVPIVPKYVNIRMVADGVSPPKHEDVADRERYLTDCVNKGIMPWTSVEFEINRDTGLMVPKRIQEMTYVGSVKGLKEATVALVRGGKFHKICLESWGMYLFPKILEKIAEFSDGGYAPYILSMDITQFHMTGYDYGDYGDTVLSLAHLTTTGDSVLGLKIGGVETSCKERGRLKAWFSDLKKASA